MMCVSRVYVCVFVRLTSLSLYERATREASTTARIVCAASEHLDHRTEAAESDDVRGLVVEHQPVVASTVRDMTTIYMEVV